MQVIDGGPDDRRDQYAQPTFYRLVNYEQVVRDREAINAWKPDVIVLDEAQRIKNWEAKTSREVKKLKSRYAMVLTGTPLENKLEELYSIVQFVDERRFGPAFQFLHEHRVLDENGQPQGLPQPRQDPREARADLPAPHARRGAHAAARRAPTTRCSSNSPTSSAAPTRSSASRSPGCCRRTTSPTSTASASSRAS